MVLAAIDKQWQAHLYNMDALREGVYLRAQGQKDPLIEYKNEAYNLFVELMGNIEQEAFHNLFRSAAAIEAFIKQLQSTPHQTLSAESPAAPSQPTRAAAVSAPAAAETPTVKLNLPKRRPSFDISKAGRNAPCPCGSGKKVKQCCGNDEASAADA
jgi:preprotein translocase subunit SecA